MCLKVRCGCVNIATYYRVSTLYLHYHNITERHPSRLIRRVVTRLELEKKSKGINVWYVRKFIYILDRETRYERPRQWVRVVTSVSREGGVERVESRRWVERMGRARIVEVMLRAGQRGWTKQKKRVKKRTPQSSSPKKDPSLFGYRFSHRFIFWIYIYIFLSLPVFNVYRAKLVGLWQNLDGFLHVSASQPASRARRQAGRQVCNVHVHTYIDRQEKN